MVPYIHIGSIKIASYGLMIVIGLIVANVIACIVRIKQHKNLTDLAILEGYAVGGALIGGITLRIITIARYVNWSYIGEPDFVRYVIFGGMVFYGGLIGALLAIAIAGKIHKLNVIEFLNDSAFMIPIMHSFGRIGCHLAGCCYGIPYSGHLAVTYPEDTMGLPGVSLFPIQLTESIILLVLGLFLLIRTIKGHTANNIYIYAITYAVIRFVLEFLRYDSIRGKFLLFSTSQWISCIILIVCVLLILRRHYRRA